MKLARLGRNRALCLTIVLVLLVENSAGALISGVTLDDVRGKPSAVTAKSTTRKVNKSLKNYAKKRSDYARTASTSKANAVSAIKRQPAPPKPVYGRLTLSIMEEVRPGVLRPVEAPPNVSIVVTTKGTTKPPLSPKLTSGNKLVFEPVGSLPAAVDVRLASEDEYSIKNGAEVAFAITKRSNAWTVASDDSPALDLASLTASLKPMMAAKPAGGAQKAVAYDTVSLTKTIVLEPRQAYLEVAAPADAMLSVPTAEGSASLEGAVTIEPDASAAPGDQKVQRIAFDSSLLENGTPAVVLSKVTDAGEFEARIEPPALSLGKQNQSENRVEAPPLRLVALKNVNVRNGLSVLDDAKDCRRALDSELKATSSRTKAKAAEQEVGDGSKWLVYEPLGVSLRTRKMAFLDSKNAPEAVEQIRLTSADGGSVAGLRVGDPVTKVLETLGPPDDDQQAAQRRVRELPAQASGASPQATLSYLQGGLLIGASDANEGAITSIDLRRPNELLQEGTTAFVPGKPISVYVESFGIDGGVDIPRQEGRSADPASDIKDMIKQMGVVSLAESKEDADYILRGSVSGYAEKRDALLDVLPYAFKSETTFSYTLEPAAAEGADEPVTQTLIGRGDTNFKEEIAGGVVLYALLIKLLSKDKLSLPEQIAAAALGVAAVDALQKSMARAIPRCRSLSYGDGLRKLADELFARADVKARATWLELPDTPKKKGDPSPSDPAPRLGLNIGSNQGLQEGSELLLDVAGRSNSSHFAGLKAEYIAARVVEVKPDSCVCELRHISRWVRKNGTEQHEDLPAIEEARGLPDPASGLVAGIVHTQFLKVAGAPLETERL